MKSPTGDGYGGFAAALAAAAQAQPNGGSPRDPRACAPGAESHLKDARHADTASAADTERHHRQRRESERQARASDGVMCPPNVDPGIKAPTPEVGKMPVIPPPGSPGGDPSVRPK